MKIWITAIVTLFAINLSHAATLENNASFGVSVLSEEYALELVQGVQNFSGVDTHTINWIERFDPSLGELQSVQLSFDSSILGSYSLTAFPAVNINPEININAWNADFSLFIDGIGSQRQYFYNESFTMPSNSCVSTGSANCSVSNEFILDVNQAFEITSDDSIFDSFIGTGSFDISFEVAHAFDFDAQGLIGTANSPASRAVWSQNIPSGFSFSYEYSPVPVPAGIWFLGSALIGLIGLKKRIRVN